MFYQDKAKIAFTITPQVITHIHKMRKYALLPYEACYMDILHVLNYWILGIFDFFVALPFELENMVRFLNF